MEIWKPVPGWEGIYSVSNMGRIRRELTHGKGVAGTLINAWLSVTGYPTVRLTHMPKRMVYQVHRLVMAAFVGHCPANKEVNHKNSIRSDPRLENLEYVTRQENVAHAKHRGRYSKNGGYNKGRKLDHLCVPRVSSTCAYCEKESLDIPSRHRTYCSKRCQYKGHSRKRH